MILTSLIFEDIAIVRTLVFSMHRVLATLLAGGIQVHARIGSDI